MHYCRKICWEGSLAAVGVCNPIMTMMVPVMNGLRIGAGVIFSCVISVLGAIFSPQILRLLQVNSTIIGITTQYLRVVMLGMIFTFIYNFYAAVFRALGDSRTPLLFLIVSSLINIAGDLFLIKRF